MVERTKSEIIEEFDGTVETIEMVPDQMNPGEQQFHLEIKPKDGELLKGSKTGMFHEWLRVTKNSSETSVAEGSKLDMYLREVETVIPDAKEAKTVREALETLKDKEIHFVKKVLGRSFKGYESRGSFVPQKLVE